MTRFIRTNPYQDNLYVEFRFQSSLRKYESKPTKRIKCDHACSHCPHQHPRKHENSPAPPEHAHIVLSKSQQKSKFKSPRQKHSAKSLISSKNIKLSKNKSSSAFPSLNKNKLQKKIYQQLQGNKLQQNKLNSNESYNEEIQQEVFLNDFQPAESINEEKQEEFNNFDYIEIVKHEEEKHQEERRENSGESVEMENKDSVGMEDKQERVEQLVQPLLLETIEKKQVQVQMEDECSGEEQQIQDEMASSESLLMANDYNDYSDSGLLNDKESQEQELIKDLDHIQLNQDQSQSNLLDSNTSVHNNQSLQRQQEVNTSNPSQQIIAALMEQPQILHHHHPVDQQEKQDEEIMDDKQVHVESRVSEKCLTFLGGRICIEAYDKRSYISVRVLNQLLKRYGRLQQLLECLMVQRPYLQGLKEQIRGQIREYMKQSQMMN